MRVTTMTGQRRAERREQVGDERAGWPSVVSRAPTSASRRRLGQVRVDRGREEEEGQEGSGHGGRVAWDAARPWRRGWYPSSGRGTAGNRWGVRV